MHWKGLEKVQIKTLKLKFEVEVNSVIKNKEQLKRLYSRGLYACGVSFYGRMVYTAVDKILPDRFLKTYTLEEVIGFKLVEKLIYYDSKCKLLSL
jgi:hypothetical protein